VVNGVPYHYEVLSGLLHVLRPYASTTDVYLNPYVRSAKADGAWELLRRSKANFVLLTRGALAEAAKRGLPEYDVVILVSTEYEMQTVATVLRHMRARRRTLAFIHNSDSALLPAILRLLEHGVYSRPGSSSSSNDSGAAAAALARDAGSAGTAGAANKTGTGGTQQPHAVELLVLSPHIATTLREALATVAGPAVAGRVRVEVVLPVFPFRPRTHCLEADATSLLGSCLNGFAMQVRAQQLRMLRRDRTHASVQPLACVAAGRSDARVLSCARPSVAWAPPLHGSVRTRRVHLLLVPGRAAGQV
jgi:hypothetical protein